MTLPLPSFSNSAMLLLLRIIFLASISHAFSNVRMMASVDMSNVGKGKTAVVAGATGYIGKSVVRESVRRGYNTIALVRDAKKIQNIEGEIQYSGYFKGAKIVECDVCNPQRLTEVRVRRCYYVLHSLACYDVFL